MKVEGFIAGRLRFKGRMAITAIAISFFIIIISVSISSGFSSEVRKAISEISGDILVSNSAADWYGDDDPICRSGELIEKALGIPGVAEARPAVYRAGIIKDGNEIHGALFKGTSTDTASMCVRIPSGLAASLGKGPGDDFAAYFISDRIKVRRFTIASVYENAVDAGDNIIVYLPISDMQRLNGWQDDEISALELMLERRPKSRMEMREKAAEAGMVTGLAASASTDRYAQLFDWLNLIEYNVYAILVLMAVVAGFNMISGLLILLFRNISTIGTLKSLGMTDRSIAGVFLRMSARLAGTGMLIGNAAALLFCLIQGTTHILKLNPENYFVSFVPVDVNLPGILLADAAAFAVIMLLQLIPTLFISKVDPSETVKSE